MNDERLYINNELVDLSSETKITLDIKSNLFRDVTKIASNSTYSVRLPKTTRNKMILSHSDSVQSKDNFAHRLHTAKYFRNGVEVIHNGRVTILQVTQDDFEVSIFWGLFPNFTAMISSGLTLNQLETKDKILYQNKNEIDTFESAKDKGFFYAGYSVWKSEITRDYTWKARQSEVYPNKGVQLSNAEWHDVGNRSEDKNIYEYLHPVAKVSYVLDLLKQTKGIDFRFKDEAKEYIDTLILPLISKKSNELTYEGLFKARLKEATERGQIGLILDEVSSIFEGKQNDEVQELRVKTDASLIFDINGEWEFNLLRGRPTGGGRDADGRVHEDFNFPQGGYWVKMTLTRKDEVKEYIIGNNSNHFRVVVYEGYRGVIRLACSAYGKVEVKAGDTITFDWVSNRTLQDAKFLGATIKTTLQEDENVPNGGFFPIGINLPKIKVIDFVKFLAVITGTFPLQLEQDNVVEFIPLSTIWNNRSNAIDWTRRLIAESDENKPKSISFVMSEYGQKNFYKWKADESEDERFNGTLSIENETLEREKTIFEFPFASALGASVPMYTKQDETTKDKEGNATGDFQGGNGGYNEGEKPKKEEKKPSYSACKDKILRLSQSATGRAIGIFDIDMQRIIDEKYNNVRETLQNAKIITERIRLRDVELVKFDETKPIYLAQYGSYFAVTEMKSEDNGIAEVTLLQLFF